MKNMLNLKTSIAMITLTLSMVGFLSGSIAYDPKGTWVCEIESPEGTINSKMIVSQNEKKQYEVKLETNEYGTLELSDIEVEGNEMTGNVEVAGGVADFELSFDGDDVEGVIFFGEAELALTGEREKN